VNGTEILLHEFPAKSHGETGETVQNIPIFSHKSGLTGLMPPWCHKSSASGPGHVAMEISHWDGTNNGVFTWHSPIYITMFVDHRPKHILLYKYMHNTFTYTYTKYIYIYRQNPPVLNFGLLAESTKFQPLAIKKTAVFVSKKNVLGRSSLNHVQVVLIQIVIPMLPLLAPAISTKSATEEHA
jgi:hypothetical protein